jgi:shikimate dehydrogenase
MAKQLYALIGHPVKHSLSPAMQNAAFRECAIDAEYVLNDVEPRDLEDFLGSLARKGFGGVNVTVPHKIKAKEYLERSGSLDANAARLGAVNAIKVDGARLSGHNTDGPGFYRSLIDDLKFEPEGKTVTILGSGGAATAVAMYLGNSAGRIFVFDVDAGKARDLAAHYAKYYDRKKLEVITAPAVDDAISKSALLVNATPVGMKDGDPSPVNKSALKAPLRVYDLVYNRPVTQLVKDAKAARCNAVTGVGMLLYQGAIAFELWTGMKAPVGVMRRALREALNNQ